LCRIKHENIAMVTRHGWLSSSFYFFDMELCQLNLEDYIRKLGKESGLPNVQGGEGDIFDIMIQITSGMEFIHGHSEVHRDLKPRNGLAL
jgi:serine/threonine protein kinase